MTKVAWDRDMQDNTLSNVVFADIVPSTEWEFSYNSATKYMRYHNGTWPVDIITWTGNQAGNAWQVKVNNGNWIKPQFVFVWWGGSNLGVFQQIIYAAPLWLSSSPTTTRPANISSPVDADIYDIVNDTFIENTIPWQVHSWRVIVEYSGKSSWADSGIAVKIENTLSGFTEETIVFAPSSTTSGKIWVLLATIADSASLPSPFGTGQGYEISITAFDPMTIDINSVSRISLAFG